MPHFEHKEFLWALAVIPAIILFYLLVLSDRKRRLRKLGDLPLVLSMIPGYSLTKQITKFALFCIAFSFLLVGIANMQTGGKQREIKRTGADIIICLDVSNSMLAEDLKPNRLERAKMAIEQMVDKLQGDRLGIIVFAGEAYTQLPITADYSSAKIFLNAINTNMVPVQGTSIAAAIELAFGSFGKKEGEKEEGKNKAIIIITDGEDHEEDALKLAAEAAQKDIVIHTIGIGSEGGVPIPVYQNGQISGYKKDKDGNTIVTKLNDKLLEDIAGSSKGVYVRASNADIGLQAILDKIGRMDKKLVSSKEFKDSDSQFQWFIAASLVFLLIEFMLDEQISKWWRKLNLFGT